jgi:predicted Zn-dependent peptidase
LLLGRVRDIKRQIDALDAIKVEDIRDAARSLFQPEAMAVAIIGPPDAAGEENLDLWQCQARELLICD